MIYIGTTDTHGSAIYFDVHSAVRHKCGISVSGTIGDGSYEGEALVELGGDESLTFADAWLGGDGFSDFLARCDVDELEVTLFESLRDMRLFKPRHSSPRRYGGVHQGIHIRENRPVWRSRA